MLEKIEVNNATYQKWVKYYKNYPMTDDMREALLNYVGNILTHKACVIFDSEHLAKLLYIENETLFAIINGTENYYRNFEIKKKSGGMREIRAPYPSLKTIQQWIYEYVLKKQTVHGCAHGFIIRRSIVTNAQKHVENKCLLKLDLKDFFPSIKINKVVQVFKNIGYTGAVSWMLARICCLDDELPQGAPTSPVLSNIVARQMDKRLYRLAKHFGYRYTRYADDISFSGDEIPVAFVKYATDIIEDCGFRVNTKKVRFYKEQDNKILTGIALKNGNLKLPRDKRRSYEQDIYYALKYGVDTRIKGEYKYFSTYILSLLGKAHFWLMLEPDNKFAKDAIPQLTVLYKQAIGMKDISDSFTLSLVEAAADAFYHKSNWGLPITSERITCGEAKMIQIEADLSITNNINIPTSEAEKLATSLINGLNKQLILYYADVLDNLPHDNTEEGIFELEKSYFGLELPLMYTYLYGGVLQENMLHNMFRKKKVDFDESIVWAVSQVPEVTLEVTRLPKIADGMKRIGKLNLYYKYEDKKLTIGTYVGVLNQNQLMKARKVIVKFE